MTRICSQPECDKPFHAKGFCKRHYQQNWATGNPEIVRPNPHGTPEERFWDKVHSAVEGECWEWTGGRDKDGYGKLRLGKTQIAAHRFSYELHNGQAPQGIVRHQCNNPPCVNPAHLLTGSHQDNMNDRRAAGNYTYATCRRGHPWTKSNTVWQNSDKTKRTCRTCRAMSGEEKAELDRAA